MWTTTKQYDMRCQYKLLNVVYVYWMYDKTTFIILFIIMNNTDKMWFTCRPLRKWFTCRPLKKLDFESALTKYFWKNILQSNKKKNDN